MAATGMPVLNQSWATWSASDVGAWVSEVLRLPQYRNRFEHNEVDGPTLLELTEEVLESELQIRSAIHRKKIVAHVKLLRARDESPPRVPASRVDDSVVDVSASDTSADRSKGGRRPSSGAGAAWGWNIINHCGDSGASEGGGSAAGCAALGCSTGGCHGQDRAGTGSGADVCYPAVRWQAALTVAEPEPRPLYYHEQAPRKAAQRQPSSDDRHRLLVEAAAQARGLPTGTTYSPSQAAEARASSPLRPASPGRAPSPTRQGAVGRRSPRRSAARVSPPSSGRNSPLRQRAASRETPVGLYHGTPFGCMGRTTSRKGSFARAGMRDSSGIRDTTFAVTVQRGSADPSPAPQVYRSFMQSPDLPCAPRAVIGTSRRDLGYPGSAPATSVPARRPASPLKARTPSAASCNNDDRWLRLPVWRA